MSLGKRQPELEPISDEFDNAVPTKRSRRIQDDTAVLARLLDFSTVSDDQGIFARFEEIAQILLHHIHLVLTNGTVGHTFQILELEFYLQTVNHQDPFTHGSQEQRKSGQWYFHRAPRRSADSSCNSTSSTGYRGGTRKGLDLTIGGPIESPYFPSTASVPYDQTVPRGGILLRSIRRLSDNKIISGPSLLVDEILRLSGAEGIACLVDTKWAGDISAFTPIASPAALRDVSLQIKSHLQSMEPPPTIYHSSRIGLDLSHPGTTNSLTHPRVVFVSRPYRYFIHPSLLTSNGRSQTLLGIRQFCLDSGVLASKIEAEIVRLTGMKKQTVVKYLAIIIQVLFQLILILSLGQRGKASLPLLQPT